MQRKTSLIFGAAALLFGAAQINAATFDVYVGYADDLRPSPFFPVPWIGAPNVIFDGLNESVQGSHFDAGAIRIDNTGATPFTFDQAVVSFWNGASFNLWGSHTVNPGQTLILTQTSTSENFDTSDVATFRNLNDPAPAGLNDPQITLKIDGITLPPLSDSGHVLDTGGFDLAALDGGTRNESLQWRLIGTTGVEDPGGNPTGAVPDAGSTLALLGLGVGALFSRARRA